MPAVEAFLFARCAGLRRLRRGRITFLCCCLRGQRRKKTCLARSELPLLLRRTRGYFARTLYTMTGGISADQLLSLPPLPVAIPSAFVPPRRHFRFNTRALFLDPHCCCCRSLVGFIYPFLVLSRNSPAFFLGGARILATSHFWCPVHRRGSRTLLWFVLNPNFMQVLLFCCLSGNRAHRRLFSLQCSCATEQNIAPCMLFVASGLLSFFRPCS